MYTFGPKPIEPLEDAIEDIVDPLAAEVLLDDNEDIATQTKSQDEPQNQTALKDYGEVEASSQPHLLASLKSHTSWPPLSLSIRSTRTTLIASIAYSLPTYRTQSFARLLHLLTFYSVWLHHWTPRTSYLSLNLPSHLFSSNNRFTYRVPDLPRHESCR